MPDKRIPEFPDFSDYGDLAPGDFLLGYMSSVNKTVKIPLSALADLVAENASIQLDTPSVDLDVISDTEIDVNITPVANATAYRVYRGETTQSEADLLVTTSGLIVNDSGLTPGTNTKYWVQAIGSGYRDSGYGFAQTSTTGAGADVTPPVLSTLEVSTTNPNQIILTYNETLQSVPSATTTQWGIVGKTCTFATVSGAVVTLTFNSNFVPGETPLLSYTGNQVKDVAGNLAATFSNQAVDNALTITAAKLATPELTAVPNSDTQINLSWTNVANESNFQIQKSSDGSTWSNLTAPSADVLAYNDTGLTSSTLYYYRIKAVGDGVNFTDSDWSTITVYTKSSVPTTWDSAIHLTGFFGTKQSVAGVTGVKLVSSPNNHIYFNAISPLSGGPMSMKITFGGTTNMYVDYNASYAGEPFLYERAGIQYLSAFPTITGQTVAF